MRSIGGTFANARAHDKDELLPLVWQKRARRMRPAATPRDLDFRAHFYFDRIVPSGNEVTSLAGIDPVAGGRNGAVAFATTRWSIVLDAQGESAMAEQALEKVCRAYWRPIYSFLRLQGIRPEEAEDVTQGFFALLLERRDLNTVRKEKGRLRSFLLVSLKHFLVDERRRAMALKRGKGQHLISLEELRAIQLPDLDPADRLTADRIYERRWALALLEEVLRRLKEEYETAGHAALFDSLKKAAPG
jgi:DNA-directed RNA polymerase specialized sigma24 family protein